MTEEKVNPTSCFVKRLFNIRQTASHGIIRAHLLLLLSPALPYAAAQQDTETTDGYGVNANVNSSMVIIVVVFICAFFFIGFFSVFLRRFMASRSAAAATITGRGDGRSRPVSAGGLNPSVIETFPIFIYSAVKDLKIGKGALECAVCLNEFKDDESLRLIPKCDHVFHPGCIDPWLASHVTCPVCRTNLIPDHDELIGNTTQSQDSNELPGEENPRSELSEAQNQVSINVIEDESRHSQALEITPKQNRPPRSRSVTWGRISGKFPRSHSTGHSLVQPGESFESYTLRLPEEVRKQILMKMKLKDTTSCDVVLPRELSSRRGNRNGEGSSSGKWYLDRQSRRSDRVTRSDRWVFSTTPPFLSRVPSIGLPKTGADGNVTAAANAKTFLPSVMGPLDCLSVKSEQTEQSTRPPV